jgi:molybdopterin synthase catalytic subunit
MNIFQLTVSPLEEMDLVGSMADPSTGACVTFEGWVRNWNEGREVTSLEYEAYGPLAVNEGYAILEEARERFEILKVRCVHRIGHLQVGEMAVWVAVTAGHRDAAFDACRYVIDEIKGRVPIWKKEHYVDGESQWVNCPRCSAAAHHHHHHEAAH